MVQLTQEEIAKIQEIIKDLPPEEQENKARELVAQLHPEALQQQCPFCLMAEGKIPTTNVYNDNEFMAVLEINPANPGHMLFFPKKHFEDTTELTDNEQQRFFTIANNLTKSLSKIAEGTNMYIANGEVAGQKFHHAIIHIIPRYKGDHVTFQWEQQKTSPEDLKTIKEHIEKNYPQKKERREEIKPQEFTTIHSEMRTP